MWGFKQKVKLTPGRIQPSRALYLVKFSVEQYVNSDRDVLNRFLDRQVKKKANSTLHSQKITIKSSNFLFNLFKKQSITGKQYLVQ